MDRNQALFDRAQKVIPGGVNSPVRAFTPSRYHLPPIWGRSERFQAPVRKNFSRWRRTMKFPLKTISIATGLVIAFGAVSAVSFSFGKAHAMPGVSGEAAAATEPAGAAIAPDEDPDLVFGRPIALEEEPADEALRALPADGPAPEMTQLPAELKKLARRLKVNPREVVISVRPLDAPGRTLLGVNDGVLEKPASTEKLVTTLAALETLGPAWRWRTGFYAAAAPDAEGVLKGGLFVRGGGDPTFVIEDFALEVERLAQLGVRRIEGDVTIDRSYFNIPDVNSSAFDGRGARPYNLPPDAALVNYRSLSVELIPDEASPASSRRRASRGSSFPRRCP